MSTTYKIKGRRFIRKYTAPHLSPSTAAGSDVAAISDRFCDVPWTQAPLDVYPEFPSYATSKVDENAAIRDCFDAAEWCGEHDDSKMHRCFANAAIYRYRLPASATLESVSVTVTCDPYTPQGARVAAMCTDSDDLPTDCSVVRTMDAHHDGVAPRTAVTNSSTGAVTWYETTASKTLTLNSTGKKWLLVFIGLEDYRARNGWLEGAAKIDKVSATFSGDVAGWDEDSQVDLRFEGVPAVALAGGSSPTWLQPLHMLAAENQSSTRVELSKKAYKAHVSNDRAFEINFNVTFTDQVPIIESSTSARFVSVSSDGTFVAYLCNASVVNSKCITVIDINLDGIVIPAGSYIYKLSLSASVSGSTYSQIIHAFPTLSSAGKVEIHIFKVNFSGESCTADSFYMSPVDMGTIDLNIASVNSIDASTYVRPDGVSDESFGDMSWQIATADVQTGTRTAEDTFDHILSLARETADHVAHDYAFAAVAFPQDELDRVTVVPRFARASSLPIGQSTKSQPGISLWFHKGSGSIVHNSGIVGTRGVHNQKPCCSNLSFLQGCFIVVRSPSDGNKIRLTAIESVQCSGISLRLDVWKSSGLPWEGTAGYHTGQKLVAATGFVDGSEPVVVAPSHSWKDDAYYSGLQDTGGVTAQLIGSSCKISSAMSANGQIDIELESPVSEGDVIIINPVAVGIDDDFSGTEAWFGRSCDPSSETTKSWCRYTENLGWYPKIEIM